MYNANCKKPSWQHLQHQTSCYSHYFDSNGVHTAAAETEIRVSGSIPACKYSMDQKKYCKGVHLTGTTQTFNIKMTENVNQSALVF